MGGGPDLLSFVGHRGREAQSKIQVYLRGENWPADMTLIAKMSSCYLKPQKRREHPRREQKIKNISFRQNTEEYHT